MAEPKPGELKVGEKESCGWISEIFGMCSNKEPPKEQPKPEAKVEAPAKTNNTVSTGINAIQARQRMLNDL